MQGGWARDLAYALASNLTPEDRREWEADLVARHGERLADAGIEPPSPSDAFLAYRQQLPHAMFVWLATLGRHRLQQGFQPHDITIELVRRIGVGPLYASIRWPGPKSELADQPRIAPSRVAQPV